MTDQYPGQPGPQPQYQQPNPGGAASWDYGPSGSQYGTSAPGGWTPAPKRGIIPLRPLTFGEIFGSTFKLLRVNVGVSLGAALIVQGITTLVSAGLPVIVALWMANRISMASPSDAALLSSAMVGWLILSVIPGILLSLVGSALVQVVIVQVVAKSVLNQKARLGETFKTSWSRFWPVLGYLGLYFAVILVFSAIFALLIFWAISLGTNENFGGMAAVIILVILLSVGVTVLAIWVFTKLTFVMPAIVLETKGPIEAIRRSWTLSNGYFWRTFGIIVLMYLIVQVMSQVISGVFSLFTTFAPTFFIPTGDVATGQEAGFIALMLVFLFITILLSVLVAAIGQVLLNGSAVIMYTDLRMRKEGLNIHLQNAVEEYSAGREPEQDPWLAPDLGPTTVPGTFSAGAGAGAGAYGAAGYGAAGYGAGGYGAGGYGAAGYPQQGYPQTVYGQAGYQQGSPQPGYAQPGHQQPGYQQADPQQDAPQPGYAQPGYQQGYPQQDASQQGYAAADSYPQPQSDERPSHLPEQQAPWVSQPWPEESSTQRVDPIGPVSPYASTGRDETAGSGDSPASEGQPQDTGHDNRTRDDQTDDGGANGGTRQ
ncbi:glycerophosphoryl diester phosphodiesterase membrane domain-containing protein [Gulosibacter molinativorax]|uniref:glycerophosphoryl diester phosphodiesterase membrane domain-containing protein n=1 Tax=Gulosibacter molinativorax TaxID=256821 RepID=UPI00040BA9C8|nr:glycerophosphoryl diester phosphodiesterase membrane domain-containing protein [Gulosibacter molinativorax]QUY62624.1 Hypotetical protein [Gulosibacter molinativorax]